jgi:hypothetical protein
VAAVSHAPKYSRICCNSRSFAVQWRAWHGAYRGKLLRPATSVSTTVSRGRVSSASLPHAGQVTGNWIIVSLMAYQSQVHQRRFRFFLRSDKQNRGQYFTHNIVRRFSRLSELGTLLSCRGKRPYGATEFRGLHSTARLVEHGREISTALMRPRTMITMLRDRHRRDNSRGRKSSSSPDRQMSGSLTVPRASMQTPDAGIVQIIIDGDGRVSATR